MNIQRMEKFIDYLRTVPSYAFNMSVWFSQGTAKLRIDRFPSRSELQQAYENKFKCGMAACLGGHAAICFPDELEISNHELIYKDSNGLYYNSEAFAKFFEISRRTAEYLTNPDAPHKEIEQAIHYLQYYLEKEIAPVTQTVEYPAFNR